MATAINKVLCDCATEQHVGISYCGSFPSWETPPTYILPVCMWEGFLISEQNHLLLYDLIDLLLHGKGIKRAAHIID